MTSVFVLLGLLTGAGVAVQAVVNNRLRMVIGTPIWAAVVQTIVGLSLLVVVGLLTRQPAPITAGWSRHPWWIWIGGILGITYVVVTIILTPRLGTALTLASIIVGQLVTALLLDYYGWLGAPVVGLSPMRIAGAAFLIIGVVLMRLR
jgi:bacterial/archaeal transporter family-2 protein